MTCHVLSGMSVMSRRPQSTHKYTRTDLIRLNPYSYMRFELPVWMVHASINFECIRVLLWSVFGNFPALVVQLVQALLLFATRGRYNCMRVALQCHYSYCLGDVILFNVAVATLHLINCVMLIFVFIMCIMQFMLIQDHTFQSSSRLYIINIIFGLSLTSSLALF